MTGSIALLALCENLGHPEFILLQTLSILPFAALLFLLFTGTVLVAALAPESRSYGGRRDVFYNSDLSVMPNSGNLKGLARIRENGGSAEGALEYTNGRHYESRPDLYQGGFRRPVRLHGIFLQDLKVGG